MGFSFKFKSLGDMRQLRTLVDFIAQQNLNYPHYEDWVQRTEAELINGYKQAILAFSDKTLVGNLIYQSHKDSPFFLELKNLRVRPEFRMRDFARFMLKQVEAESKGKYSAIICDARADRHDSVSFMLGLGYSQLISLPLYESNSSDIVLIKFFDDTNKGNLEMIAKKFSSESAV